MRLIAVAAALLLSASSFAELPVPAVNRSPFGAQTVWPNQPNFELVADRMQEAGVQWTRFDLAWWNMVEDPKGTFNFNPGEWQTDRAVRMLRERRIDTIAILSYGNRHYDTKEGKEVAPFTDEGRAAFARYAHEAARRYRGDINHWEIWNEPNLEEFWTEPNAQDYVKLVKATAPRIREANPDAVILAGATSKIGFEYLKECAEAGMLDYIDVITIHPYRETKPETVAEDYAEVRALLDKHSTRHIPIWDSEWGYTIYHFELSEENQAKVVARKQVAAFAAGMDLSIWFSFHPWSEEDKGDAPPAWGLIYKDGRPRPSFTAMKTLNEVFKPPIAPAAKPWPTTVTAEGGEPKDLEMKFFRRNRGEEVIAAIWRSRWPLKKTEDTPVPVGLDFETPNHSVRAIDGLTGEEIPLMQARIAGRIKLGNVKIHDYPIYLVFTPTQ